MEKIDEGRITKATLEVKVKEVDFDKEIQDYIYKLPHSKTHFYDGLARSWREQNVIEIAKHFFELGLKIQK